MTSRPIMPCLWLDDQAEQAAQFYAGLFPNSLVTGTSHYPKFSDNPSGKPRGSVLAVEFELAGQRFTALNGGPLFAINPSISFFVHVDNAYQADRLFSALVTGGDVLMPLASYPWSERYGWVQDRFGVSWQMIAGRRPSGEAVIVPCMMFAGSVQGKAEEAMLTYTRIFPQGRIDSRERYAKGEGPLDTIKHGRFVIDGQEMIAMDSHIAHEITFNEGVSFQVMCNAQSEVDRYWALLSEGGNPGPCGWLKDRFGVSWQVVPATIADWMASKNEVAKDRAFAAMLTMTKLDIAALEAAFEGRG